MFYCICHCIVTFHSSAYTAKEDAGKRWLKFSGAKLEISATYPGGGPVSPQAKDRVAAVLKILITIAVTAQRFYYATVTWKQSLLSTMTTTEGHMHVVLIR